MRQVAAWPKESPRLNRGLIRSAVSKKRSVLESKREMERETLIEGAYEGIGFGASGLASSEQSDFENKAGKQCRDSPGWRWGSGAAPIQPPIDDGVVMNRAGFEPGGFEVEAGLVEVAGPTVELAEGCVEQVVVSDGRVLAHLVQRIDARKWAVDFGDNDRPVDQVDRRAMDREHCVVEPQDGRPIGVGVGRRRAVIHGDSGLEMEDGDRGSFGRLIEELSRPLDQPLVPSGAVLVFHEQDAASFVEPRVQAGGVKQHQGHERTRRGSAAVRVRTQEMTEIRGVFAEIGANGRFAPGRAMPFVENQVEDLVHGVEPVDELRGVGRVQRYVVVDEFLGGALQSLLDRFFIDQEAPSDFGGAKTAQCFQGQGKLVFSRQQRMTAGENHLKLAVFDGGVEKEVVDSAHRESDAMKTSLDSPGA